KAFRVFNKRTNKVEENLHVDFLENKLIEKGTGLNWLFDIDTLTNSMNYVLVVVAGKSSTNILAHMEIRNSDAPDDCNTNDPESSGIEVPTATSKVPSAVKWSMGKTYWHKMVLKNKKDERGIMIRNKARLVVQGYTQEEGIDYEEVFAPVARIEAIRLFLAYVSFMGFIVYQMDVKSAFLYGTIDEEVYVMQPPRFQDPEFPDRVYKVEKTMYGLHQAPRACITKLDGIFLSQDKYIGDIIKKFGYSDVRSANTPINKENPWGKDGPEKDVELHIYISMIGSLMYLTASRPDIIYLKGHPKLGLWYPKESPFDLVAYSDSNYGGATQDKKSTTGGCQFLGRSKAFRVFNKRTNKVEENLQVDFLENKLIEKGTGLNWLFDIDTLTNSMNYVLVVVAGKSSTNISGTKDVASQDVKKDVSSLRYIALLNWFHEAHMEIRNSDAPDDCNADDPESMEYETPTVSSPVPTVCLDISPESLSGPRLITKGDFSQKETPSLGNALTLSNMFKDIFRVKADLSNMETSIPEEPKNIFDALKDPSWVEAMQEELLQFKIQNVWVLVDCPKGMDVKSAFLYGTIDEEVYVMQPPGFQDPEFPDRVYKVEKTMYGLHQAPRAWYGTLSKYLLDNGFQRGTTDQTLFIRKHKGEFLLVQVITKLDGIFLLQDKYVGDIIKKFGYSNVRQGDAFPTVSSLDAGQDRENIAKTSALPHDSSPRVTSLDADEGSTQQRIHELMELCTILQRKQSQMVAKIKDQDLEISRLKARVKFLEDKESRSAEHTQEDAPITRGIKEIGEEVRADKRTKLGSNDTKEMVNILSSMEAANILTSGGAAASVSPADVLLAAGVPTVSGSFPTASAIFTTANVVTPYTRRPRGIIIGSSQPMRSLIIIGAKDKGKEKVVKSEVPKKRKLQEQIDAQVAREMEEEFVRENQRVSEQLARDSKIARLHVKKELKMMIEGLDRNNEVIAKHLREYEQAAVDLYIGEKLELISELVKYQDHRAKILKYQAQQSKPLSKKEKREFYMSVLKSHAGWKTKHFRGMTLEQIKEKFIPVWKQLEDFVPMSSKEESERVKRQGLKIDQGGLKRMKTFEDVSEEELKGMMQLVPLEEVYVEALLVKHPIIDWEIHSEGKREEDLHQLWTLVKETFCIRQATIDKENELWVELKRLFELNFEDQLWTYNQAFMHDPLDWKLYDTCGVHHVSTKDQEIFMLVERDYPLRKRLVTVMIIENCKAKSSEEEPKVVKKYDDALIIEEWVSDNKEEDVSQPKIEKKTVRLSISKIEFVKSKQQKKTARKTIKQVEQHWQNTHSPRGNQRN
nr:hypothetical protein [Tanacetum cinerariifolium]